MKLLQKLGKNDFKIDIDELRVGKGPNSSSRKNVAREQKNGMEPFWSFPCKAPKTVRNVYMNQGKYDSEC